MQNIAIYRVVLSFFRGLKIGQFHVCDAGVDYNLYHKYPFLKNFINCKDGEKIKKMKIKDFLNDTCVSMKMN